MPGSTNKLVPGRPEMYCIGCGKRLDQIQEYLDAAQEEKTTPDNYVWEEEGTLNRENGHFMCTTCYVHAGCPSSPTGWKAP